MPSLFAPARALFISTVLAMGLGCAGAMNGAMQLAGVDMQLSIGAEAVHPDDFPAKPPASGDKAMSMRFKAAGESINLPPDFQLPDGVTFDHGTEYTLEIVVYTVQSADLDGLCSTARDQVAAAGWATKDPGPQDNPDIKEVSLFGQGQDLFGVMGTDDKDGASFVLLRITPTQAAGDTTERTPQLQNPDERADEADEAPNVDIEGGPETLVD